jgi:hypothetical protein
MTMIGYKAFNKDLTCRDFQYEIGKTYEMEEEPIPCAQGFHFCKAIGDCYRYYSESKNTRICKVEALGDVVTNDDMKYCTNKIKIVEEITEDWKRRGNTSSSSTGYVNTGVYNFGNHNAGTMNSGDYNTGHGNIGCSNVGNHNTGNCNVGDKNSGGSNSGNRNLGRGNSGDWNSGLHNSGVFNTDPRPKIKMFDKESDWTYYDWISSRAYTVMCWCPFTRIDIDGHLYKITTEDKQKWWDNLSEEDKQAVLDLPNFDKDKFKQCTGIEV